MVFDPEVTACAVIPHAVFATSTPASGAVKDTLGVVSPVVPIELTPVMAVGALVSTVIVRVDVFVVSVAVIFHTPSASCARVIFPLPARLPVTFAAELCVCGYCY